MNPDADDTTPSDEMLVRYNADLDDAKTLSEAKAISDRYLVEFPDQQAVLLEFLDLTFQRLHRFAVPLPVPAPRLLEPGDRLAAFSVVGFVAAGGMGEIYEAKLTTWSGRLR